MQNIFIISTGRAASSSMYRYMDEFFELNLPRNKEPHYYLNAKKLKKKPNILKKLLTTKKKTYKSLYRNSKVSVDASVGYFFYIDDFLKRSKLDYKNSKIIFLYREPIERAKSLFTKQFINGYERNLNFKEAFSRKNSKIDKNWWQFYYNNVNYFNNFLKIKQFFKEILVIEFKSYPLFLSKHKSILENFLKLEKKNTKKITAVRTNTSNIQNILVYTNFVKFFKKKNKIKNLFKLIKHFIKYMKIILLRIRMNNANLSIYFQESLSEYRQLNLYLKNYKICKGVYIVR